MKYEWIVSAAAMAVGLVGIGYAIGQRKKLNDISNKLDTSIRDLADKTDIDIPVSVINKAVDRAVSEEVDIVVPRAVEKAVKAVTDDISKQVASAISEAHDKIDDEVRDEITRQVERIDIEKLKRTVVADAKKAAADKLEGSLDDILEDFNRNLKNLSSVYSSMAETMKGAGKKVELSLG